MIAREMCGIFGYAGDEPHEWEARMGEVLDEIKDGSFAARFIADQDAGAPEFRALREAGESHPIEGVGRELRGLMSWIRTADDDYTEGTAAR